MPIEDQIPTLDGNRSQFDKDADASLEIVNAARVSNNVDDFDRRGNEASRRLFDDGVFGTSTLTETGTNRIKLNKRGEKFVKAATAVALTGALAGGIGAGINLNNEHMENSKTVVGVDTFMPSPETGETWGQADATVNQILEENGLDPNIISYSATGDALNKALKQEREVSGQIYPGAIFDTKVFGQTDIFGNKHHSVEIDSSKYLDQQNTPNTED